VAHVGRLRPTRAGGRGSFGRLGEKLILTCRLLKARRVRHARPSPPVLVPTGAAWVKRPGSRHCDAQLRA
jgi:hypothetical protein